MLGAHQLPLGYFLNSMIQGPAKERLKIISSNAECVSICGDKPTPQGYSFTCKHMNNLMHYFISKLNFATNRKLRDQN